MKKILWLFPLIITGCAPNYTWKHPTATQSDFNKDLAYCKFEAEKATASYSGSPGYSTAIGQGIADGIEIGTRQRRIGELCMQSKGYYQAPIER